MNLGLARFALWAWLACWVACASAQVPVPPLKSRVTDLTATLDSAQRSALEQSLATFEAKKGGQIAILLVPTTQPEAIEQFSLRVAEAWKLGRKGVDDGVLLLVAKNDRKLRIEVGYGLEGALPDAIAKRIVAETIAPQFKQGNYYAGLQAGVARIVGTLEGEPPPPPKPAPSGQEGDSSEWWTVLLVAALVGGGIMRALFGALFGALATGAIAGGVVWLLLESVLLGCVAALLIFVATLLGAGSGIGSSGGWSSGGGSGGGFSGGGGSFGGGGASGDW